jgi:cholesterol oxidase
VHFAGDGQAEGQIIDDPFQRGGPPQGTCTHCGRCVTGCPIHAKNTLDLNYLWLAEHKYGAQIAPLHEASCIQPDGDGYRVRFWQRAGGRRSEGSVWGKTVILAAGAVGSTELLLRSKRAPAGLPRLSDALGLHFSGNGDVQAGVMAMDPRIPVQSYFGPIITRAIEFSDSRVFIEEGAVSREFAGILKYLYSPAGAVASWISARLRGRPRQGSLRNFLASVFRRHAPLDNALILLVMGRDAADGKLRLSARGELEAQWDNRGSRELFRAIEEIVRQMAEKVDGIPYFSPRWAVLRRLITVHPLGGCAMAGDVTGGVVNHRGEVFHYPGLYVLDGSIIPTAIGKNPAMTIAALAERAAFWMVHEREMAKDDACTPRNC